MFSEDMLEEKENEMEGKGKCWWAVLEIWKNSCPGNDKQERIKQENFAIIDDWIQEQKKDRKGKKDS